MAKYTYYCQVQIDSPEYKQGIYSFSKDSKAKYVAGRYTLIGQSDVVWRQGPKGGVKITKDRRCIYPYGYITNSNKHMKEFMWVKLKAKELE